MKLEHQLALITVLGFLVFLVFNVFNISPRRFYILFVLYFLPLMDLPITPPNWGSLRVFDGISYISFLFIFGDFISFQRRHKIYHILFGLLILVLLLGSLSSDFISDSLVAILSIFPIFIYSKSIINECYVDVKFKNKVIQILKIVAIFSIVFLIAQMIIGLNFTFYTELNRNTLDSNGFRYPSFFHDPQKYQQFLAMLSFLFLINYKQIEKPNYKNYLFFIIVISAMIATGGRSAFLGLFAGMLLLFFFLGFRYKVILFILCLISGILIFNYSDSLLILQRSQTFGEDYLYRASLWYEAFQIFKDHPLFGIGFENYHNFAIAHSQNYFINAVNDVIFFDQPESGYLKILTELGILGFILSFSFIVISVLSGVERYYANNKNLVVFLFIASIISWLVSFASIYSISDKRILILVITFVCLLITTKNLKTKHVIKIK